MKHIVRLIPLLFLLVAAAATADTIHIMADQWCPYNCEPESERPGYMIEIARRVFEDAGHTVQYSNTFWSRAIKDVRRGKIDAIVGASEDEAPGLVFPEEELGFSFISFFTRKEDSWTYHGAPSLEAVRAGIQKDYDYGEEVGGFFEANQNTDKVQIAMDGLTMEPLPLNIEKLLEGKIDVIPEDRNVFMYTAQKLGVLHRVRNAGQESLRKHRAKQYKVYIAFSPKNPRSAEYAALLTAGVRKLRESGELSKILKRYELVDWKDLYGKITE